MRPKYDGVKYYSDFDLSIGFELRKAEEIILSIDVNKKYVNINEVIELYNIQQLFNIGVSLSDWTYKKYAEYCNVVKSFKKIIGQFFSNIDDDNFMNFTSAVTTKYIDDFWTLFAYYKLFNKISNKIFLNYLQLWDTDLGIILKHKNIVNYYDECLAEFMRTSEKSATIIISKYLIKSNLVYFIPSKLEPEDIKKISQIAIAS